MLTLVYIAIALTSVAIVVCLLIWAYTKHEMQRIRDFCSIVEAIVGDHAKNVRLWIDSRASKQLSEALSANSSMKKTLALLLELKREVAELRGEIQELKAPPSQKDADKNQQDNG